MVRTEKLCPKQSLVLTLLLCFSLGGPNASKAGVTCPNDSVSKGTTTTYGCADGVNITAHCMSSCCRTSSMETVCGKHGGLGTFPEVFTVEETGDKVKLSRVRMTSRRNPINVRPDGPDQPSGIRPRPEPRQRGQRSPVTVNSPADGQQNNPAEEP